MASENSTSDPESGLFEELLTLEDQYYAEGYELGSADGAKEGRLDGRSFGFEKGFEKFVEMGRLAGQASVWRARLSGDQDGDAVVGGSGGGKNLREQVKPLGRNERLRKHVLRLSELTDPETLPTSNSEEGVEEVEERMRDAKAKAVLISRAFDESDNAESSTNGAHAGGATDKQGRGLRLKAKAGVPATAEMEDFVGLPRAKK